MSVVGLTRLATHSDDGAGSASLPMDIRIYSRKIKPTDRLPPKELNPVLMGLFGEIGSIMAALKKRVREQASYPEYSDAVEDEFGDALWYFAALCRRLEIQIDSIVGQATDHLPAGRRDFELPNALLELGKATGELLSISGPDTRAHGLLRTFWVRYLAALQAADIDLNVVLTRNLRKACGRFLEPAPASLPTFDELFPPDERLPESFEITIRQRPSGQTYLQWNGVFIGAPLTDNIEVSDGYRYHDVFHLAHAAILHWSPTVRSLTTRKRKTDSQVDEAQDGGRAIVVEEGLTAWVFSRAKQLGYFEHQDSVSFDLLKIVQQFVRGYEVEECPLNLWERAILQGYAVFRQTRANNGGVIVGNRSTRSIRYRPLPDDCA